MSTQRPDEAHALEACIEALEETATTLAHHPPHVLAAALGIHLQAVLGVLYAYGQCSAQQIRSWLEEIERYACAEEP